MLIHSDLGKFFIKKLTSADVYTLSSSLMNLLLMICLLKLSSLVTANFY